jgi:hypothetical protein
MGRMAAVAVGSGTAGLMLWCWPVAVGLGGEQVCGPAVIAAFQLSRADDPPSRFIEEQEGYAQRVALYRRCGLTGIGYVAAGVVLAVGGATTAAALGPSRDDRRGSA